jgi:hypothetical protein
MPSGQSRTGGDQCRTYRTASSGDRGRNWRAVSGARARRSLRTRAGAGRRCAACGLTRRAGVPQGRHVHALLAGGQRALGELFPGFESDLVRAGVVPFRIALDVRVERPGFDPFPHICSRRPCGPRNLMKIALRYDRRGRERQGRALTGAVKAVYLSDPERACWANKWASVSCGSVDSL